MTATVARQRLAIVDNDRAARVQAAQAEAVIAKKDQQIRVLSSVHEATRPSRNRKRASDWGSANSIVGQDARQLRTEARRLERDHDIARNALNILQQNTVGSGIDVIPAPRKAGGEIDRDLAAKLKTLWDAWWDRPEVTKRHDWGKCQQLLARSLYRDGEVFYQPLIGPVPFLRHGTGIPFSIEMLEADMVPLDMHDLERRIRQGVETNAWGEPVAYHVYKSHPGDGFATLIAETKRVSADQLRHVALTDRIHQLRGLSIFASVITRLADIKEYEDSERIAAKVAASLSAQIKKGDAAAYTGGASAGDMNIVGQTVLPSGDREYRALTMRPGMIADDLLPGESIELIDSKRPNPNTELFRSGQLRAASGGLLVSYSGLSRDYSSGTYSSQRQELVEQWGVYQTLGEFHIATINRPVWRDFVVACVLSNQVRMPAGWTLDELCAATYVRPVMPWIDPMKESLAMGEAEDRGWVAPQQNILLRGNDPDEVLRQRRDWQQQLTDTGNVPPAPTLDPEARARLRRDVVSAVVTENT
ncbi:MULTISPECIES: phage portal protein [Luteimonas]|uniref:phage portal protein n=1 Tax=Luteimonas TaxID=83614 RepID=UPI000C7A322E|nr:MULTISPECIES: phage portal protein [Luteimonas]